MRVRGEKKKKIELVLRSVDLLIDVMMKEK